MAEIMESIVIKSELEINVKNIDFLKSILVIEIVRKEDLKTNPNICCVDLVKIKCAKVTLTNSDNT